MRYQEISAAVSGDGWRYVLGELVTAVPVGSLARAAEVATLAAAACGTRADGHLRVDARPDRVTLSLQDRAAGTAGAEDVELARALTAALAGHGLSTGPDLDDTAHHAVQLLEIAVDAMDIPAVRPFWKAVLGYVDEPGRSGPTDALVDPLGRSPAVWFQQMDAPRPQRNRIHLDVSVPHDEAQRRIAAALAAGGTLRYDAEAPAFWVLADPEGNEACVTTWQGRD
jgi:4a-hydroxytetrahydrobiopterin dehydratase